MEQDQRQIIKKYIDLFLRRKKIIVICVMIASIAAVGIYLKSPKRYKATSLLIYQRQRINPSKLSPDVKTRTREMVSTLTQQVTSRTSLEKIIKQFGLYKDALQNLPMEDVIVNMRKDINIKPTKGDVFQVEFIGSTPKSVMLVTNSLASLFIEENLRFREEKASETSAYVSDELAMSKVTMDEKEKRMRDYKLKYYNEMPRQLDINMSRLNSLQTQFQSNELGQRDLERTKILIQEQISNRVEAIAAATEKRRVLESEAGETDPLLGGPQTTMMGLMRKRNLSAQEVELLKALKELDSISSSYRELSTKYTPNHPEIKRLKRLVSDKEEEKNRLILLVQKSSVDDDVVPVERTLRGTSSYLSKPSEINNQLNQLRLQLDDVTFNISNLKQSKKKIAQTIEMYKGWISSAPAREAEWTTLTRDYDQLNAHYQQLVTLSLNAQSAQTLERRQKGSQFKIVDSAHLPEKPFTPDFKKIILMALALGLGVGSGTALFIETVQTSFKDAVDLETFLDVPVICAIPNILIKREKRVARIIYGLWWVAFFFVGGAIILGTAYLWYNGRIIL